LADNAVDTAEIADNAVTLAKMAGLARGTLIYGDASGDPAALAAGGADEVLTHDGTDLSWAAAGGGGITVADHWRLSSPFTGDATPIASNLEQVDTGGFGGIGSAMTESSGVFTFPSTGVWLIQFQVKQARDGDNRYSWGIISTTVDNGSTWVGTAVTGNFIQQTSGSATISQGSCQAIFDVTDTTNCKVRFTVAVADSDTQTDGETSRSDTGFMFIRLGDT
jgi:hypothetical protein